MHAKMDLGIYNSCIPKMDLGIEPHASQDGFGDLHSCILAMDLGIYTHAFLRWILGFNTHASLDGFGD